MSELDRAKRLMDDNKFEEAVEILRKAELNGVPGAGKLLRKALSEWAAYVNKLGDKLYKRKAYRDAINYYTESIDLAEEAGDKRKVKNYTDELNKTLEKLAQEINNKGDRLYKDGKYREAIKVYEESIKIMEEAGNEKKLANFKEELRKTHMALAEKLAEEAEKLAESKEMRLDEAEKKMREALKHAKLSENKKFYAEIEKKGFKIYEDIADAQNKLGDKAFKSKNWKQAIEYYRKSVELIKKANNPKKLENYKRELARAFKENAEEINKAADKAFKNKEWETAIEIYQESIEAAKMSGDDKLIANYEKELAKAFEMYAKEVNEVGDKLFKEGTYPEAAKVYLKSVQLAEKSNKKKLLENFTKELRKTYEAWAKEYDKEGDKLFKDKRYEDAIEKYKKALEIIEVTGDPKLIKEYKKEVLESYKRWASEINKEGDKMYELGKYEDAFNLYQKSVELAQMAEDARLVKKFRKERDKALKMLQ